MSSSPWEGGRQRRGWLPEEDGFPSVPRAFLTTELCNPGQVRTVFRGEAPSVAQSTRCFPVSAGRAGDGSPPPPPPLSKAHPFLHPPRRPRGSPLASFPCTSSTHPAAVRFLSRLLHPGLEKSGSRGGERRPSSRVGLDASSSGGTSIPYSHLTPPLSLFRSVVTLSARCSATVPAADWGGEVGNTGEGERETGFGEHRTAG